MRPRCCSMVTVPQVRAAQSVQTVIHLVHLALIRIQINHLPHNQKPIWDIHHSLCPVHNSFIFIFALLFCFYFIFHQDSSLSIYLIQSQHWESNCGCLFEITTICFFSFFFAANWTEIFPPPPPEHPPPLPLANCAQTMGMCYVPTSPDSMRRAAAQWAGTGLANHQK